MPSPSAEAFEVKGVFIDLDGVLRDDRQAINAAAGYALERAGVDVEDWDKEVRPHLHSVDSVRENLASHVAPDRFLGWYDEMLRAMVHTMGVYPHAHEVLEELCDAGRRLALVTSSRTANDFVEAEGMDGFFETIVDALTVTHRKPHPEPVNCVLGRMGLRPEEVVMVEDTLAGLKAAEEAGLAATIAVTHGFGDPVELAARANYTIDSLAPLPRVVAGITSLTHVQ